MADTSILEACWNTWQQVLKRQVQVPKPQVRVQVQVLRSQVQVLKICTRVLLEYKYKYQILHHCYVFYFKALSLEKFAIAEMTVECHI